MMSDLINKLTNESLRIEEDTEHSFKGHYNAADRWSRYHLFLGLPGAVLAALGGIAVVNEFPGLAVGLAITSSALTAVLTFLKPSERSEIHKTVAGQYQALRNRARLFREIELIGACNEEEAKENLLMMADQRDELNQTSPALTRSDYELAKKDIDSGRARYRADGGGHEH